MQFRATFHPNRVTTGNYRLGSSHNWVFSLCTSILGIWAHLPKITFLSDLSFSGKIIPNSGWWPINEEVIKLQWNCLFLYRCYLSKPTKECTTCKMPCFGGDFSMISKFQSMLFVLAKTLIFSALLMHIQI